jgi:hypothetical protein
MEALKMPLTEDHVDQFRQAILAYSFPSVCYDFLTDQEVEAVCMTDIESIIERQLRSAQLTNIKHGLANILYWGYANVGYRWVRVNNFITNVTALQLMDFRALLANNNMPTMLDIKNIRMPEYSGMSFLSKVLMFLNPQNYCILDRQIAKLRSPNSPKALNHLSLGPTETQIRISDNNEEVYNSWRYECQQTSEDYFNGNFRVVDIERGFFQLIQQGLLPDAQSIYDNA